MTDVPNPPLPEPVSIPHALIEDWVKLSDGAELNLALRRQDVDHLVFALDKHLHATDWLRVAMIHFVNGSVAEGHDALNTSQRHVVESQNRLRQFMISLMHAATRSTTGS